MTTPKCSQNYKSEDNLNNGLISLLRMKACMLWYEFSNPSNSVSVVTVSTQIFILICGDFFATIVMIYCLNYDYGLKI